MMLEWNVNFKKDQHDKVIQKLCRKLKVEPINCVFTLSGHRDKLSSCRFEVALNSSVWMEAVSESLEIAYRISPHWHLSMRPPKYFSCSCGEGYIESLEGLISWSLQMDSFDFTNAKDSEMDTRNCEQDASSDGDKHPV